MNPLNNSPLTANELREDCLCYLGYNGSPVKASRLFSGHEHEQQVKRIADHFNQDPIKFRTMAFDPGAVSKLQDTAVQDKSSGPLNPESAFGYRDITLFNNATDAYHQLIMDLIRQQVHSVELVLNGTSVKRIFVDGGFSKNAVYM